jgi:hypothetical protein
MLNNFCKGLLLSGAMAFGATTAVAQSAPIHDSRPVTIDVAGTIIFEHSQIAQQNGNRFWPKGGGINAAFTVWKGVGLAVDVSGEHASNIQNGVNLGKFSVMAGPRYTFNLPSPGETTFGEHHPRAFVQGLFGPTHAFDSLFPGPISLSTSANALSVKLGGGVDVPMNRSLAVRAIELGWIHSDYSNAAADVQNDFRIGFGITYRR